MNNFNKPNKNQAIKNRKSTSPFMSSSLSDPMNSLQNTTLKEKRINMINNFLIVNNYPNNFNKKDFANMSVDFRPILKFIMQKLDPNVNLLDSLTDDKIENLSKIYEYPGKVTRSMIRDFNTPSNFLYILTFMCYMANLATCKDYFTEKEIKNIYFTNNNNNIEANNQDELYIFLNECISASANNNVNEVLQKYKAKFDYLSNEELNRFDKMYVELEQLENDNKELQKKLPNIDIIKNQESEVIQKYNILNEEYIKSNDEINKYNLKLNEINNFIDEQEKKLILLDNEIKSTRNIIDNQIMSRAEYDIKQEENNSILNKINNYEKEINNLTNMKIETINNNQSLLNKLTILSNDINNIDINNSKTIKSVQGVNNNESDISLLLNMSLVNKKIKNNIINNIPNKNDELLNKYEDYISKYKTYIKKIKEEYNNKLANNKELEKNKELAKSEIEKYNNLLINDNKIGNDRKDLLQKINNEYLKYKIEKNEEINKIKNDIKIYENNIEEKKKQSVKIENEYVQLKKEFDEYKNETQNIVNTLTERYNAYYNNFIDTTYEITSKILDCNKNLNNVCNSLPKNDNKKNFNLQNKGKENK